MSNQNLDIQCFSSISEFEISLRRLVRWELMGVFGRAWYTHIGNYSSTIDDRIARESRVGMARGGNSLLSYLSLGEVINLIFKDLWQHNFYTIFSGKKSFQRELFQRIIPIRNKVAHFRPVSSIEIEALGLTKEIFSILRATYGKTELTEFYNSGESERGSELIDSDLIFEAKKSLNKYSAFNIWDEFINIQWLRAYGIFPGIGIFNKHLFIEFYFDNNFSPASLFCWVQKREYEVTFASFSESPNMVRIFLPMVIGEKDLVKSLRALSNAAKEGVVGSSDFNFEISRLDLSSEMLINKNAGSGVCFAF